jgi:hypothetical protein
MNTVLAVKSNILSTEFVYVFYILWCLIFLADTVESLRNMWEAERHIQCIYFHLPVFLHPADFPGDCRSCDITPPPPLQHTTGALNHLIGMSDDTFLKPRFLETQDIRPPSVFT